MISFGDHEPGPAPEELSIELEEEQEREDPNQPVAVKLIRLAEQRFQFGVTPSGDPFAYQEDKPHLVHMFRGGRRGLRADLARAFFETEGRVANQAALADCLVVLEGVASDVSPEELHLRVAEKDGAVYIDRGDPEGTVFRVAGGKWTAQTTAPVKFHRTELTSELPAPGEHPEGAVGVRDLFGHLNIVEEDHRPVLAWLVASLIAPNIPHPVLALLAEQGTAKSTATKRLGQMVDPSSVQNRTAPRGEEQWVTAAAGSWVVGIDNASSIQPWFSDALCRAVTGDGDVKRRLYSDGDLAIIRFRRCVILNGIDIGALRGDLSDRLLAVNLHMIPEEERRPEDQLNAEWDENYPYLFGALLSFSAEVHELLPSIKLEKMPRMADFARILAAVDQVADKWGLPGESGLDRFTRRAEDLAKDSLASNAFIMGILVIAEKNGIREKTSAEILKEVELHMQLTEADWRRPQRGWPTSPKAVTGFLKRNIPQMRKTGWQVFDDEGRNKDGTIRWTIELEEGSNPAPPSPPPLLSQMTEVQHDG
ncbi:hypothetical protein COCCU_03805 [Corynebacterium occultum]|uniref:ATP-binding protein n=1 Tax=Corynebacterium occultum TaxID=2675219 RepID=A0A6B8W9N2_9CORY|nr:ATP-binding protein [Corynebacterium occultum]QGU06710.1 hypothetical protein COCCU_03805 [Corynebacterium occultum]